MRGNSPDIDAGKQIPPAPFFKGGDDEKAFHRALGKTMLPSSSNEREELAAD
jgi:hypothetical protein